MPESGDVQRSQAECPDRVDRISTNTDELDVGPAGPQSTHHGSLNGRVAQIRA